MRVTVKIKFSALRIGKKLITELNNSFSVEPAGERIITING